MDPLVILTYVAIVLMIGVLCSIISKALKLPNALLLILMGMLLGSIYIGNAPLVEINDTFVIGIGTLALIMLAFDSSSRLKVGKTQQDASTATRIIRSFLLLSIVVMSFFTAGLIFGGINLSSVVFSLLFSIMVVETDLGSMLIIFREYAKEKANRIISLLEIEANLNTPVVIILPFLVLELIASINFNSENLEYLLLSNVPQFIMLLITSVGVGLIVGLIVLRFMKDHYSQQFSPIAIIAAGLVAYLLSARLGGDGILAVATMGLIFGNVYVKGKEQLEEFSMMLSNAIEIIIFVMVGIVIKVPFTWDFILRSLLLFGILVLIRIVAVSGVLKKNDFTAKEKIFISLNMPKGITIATVVLVLSTFRYTDITVMLQLMVMFMLYSLILSAIVDMNAKRLLGHEVSDEPVKSTKPAYVSEFSMIPEAPKQKKTRAARKRKSIRKQELKKRPKQNASAKKKSTSGNKASNKATGKKIIKSPGKGKAKIRKRQ